MLYQDAELRREMGVRARERAEQFTWEAYRVRLGELLGQVLGRGSAMMERQQKPRSYAAAAV
jgi:hypothetical protein